MMDLFEAAEARQAEGLALVVANAGESWVDYATAFMHRYCLNNGTVFCDDVWQSGLERPASPRAFGTVMKHALKQGWIVKTYQARPSTQSNNALRNVYRSTIYQPKAAA